MYIANVQDDGFENNPMLDSVREFAAKEGSMVVPICAAIEAENFSIRWKTRKKNFSMTWLRRSRTKSCSTRWLFIA